MKRNLLLAINCAALLLMPSIVHSAEGLYISGNVGAGILADSNVTDSTVPGLVLTVGSDTGFTAGAALGYDFGNNFRAEVEYVYQQNDLNTASLAGVAVVAVTGDTSSHTGLLNGYYDFTNETVFTPFIGAGIGFSKFSLNNFNVPGSGLPNANADDTVFAYQGTLGVSYTASPTVSIDVKYRYFATANPMLVTSEIENSTHNVSAGVRISF